jgi:hypothetical protein
MSWAPRAPRPWGLSDLEKEKLRSLAKGLEGLSNDADAPR